jgi:RNA polymerase sigma-70 factor (ECF subfamily)
MAAAMSASPETRASLLVRIRDLQDRMAWSEFVHIYAPLIHAYAMHRGLQDADAADVAQVVLSQLLRAAPGFRYDPSRGQFRAWLFTITLNELRKVAKRHARQPVGTGESEVRQLLEQHPDDAESAYWDREYQRQLFDWVAKKVQSEFRETTWQAFWATAVENREIKEVAQELGISVGAIYIARSRILVRIREEIEKIEGA